MVLKYFIYSTEDSKYSDIIALQEQKLKQKESKKPPPFHIFEAK